MTSHIRPVRLLLELNNDRARFHCGDCTDCSVHPPSPQIEERKRLQQEIGAQIQEVEQQQQQVSVGASGPLRKGPAKLLVKILSLAARANYEWLTIHG